VHEIVQTRRQRAEKTRQTPEKHKVIAVQNRRFIISAPFA
jgi:hypothetical protein